MNYRFTSKCLHKNAASIWKFIQNGLSKDVTIKSTKDKLPYTVNYINNEAISFSASTRNNGEPEFILFEDFVTVMNHLKALQIFNTNTAKPCFKGSKMYKKRSPFFALLVSSGVLEQID